MKNKNSALLELKPGLRLGVGRGQLHLNHFCPIEGQEGFWQVDIKQRIDSKWPFTAQLPIGFIEDLQRVESLEKRHKAATEKARYWQNEAKEMTAKFKASNNEKVDLKNSLDELHVSLVSAKNRIKDDDKEIANLTENLRLQVEIHKEAANQIKALQERSNTLQTLLTDQETQSEENSQEASRFKYQRDLAIVGLSAIAVIDLFLVWAFAF
jgi:hypothetical protein